VGLGGQEKVGEDRAGAKLEVRLTLVPDRRAGHVRRHQVGSELDSRELHAQDLREGAGSEGLRKAWVVLEQNVPIGEEADQHELEGIPLADDRALDFVQYLVSDFVDARELHQSDSSDSTASRRSAGGT